MKTLQTITPTTIPAKTYKSTNPFYGEFLILGDNILDHLQITQKAEWAVRDYFRHHPLWDALYNYITKSDVCVLFDRPGNIVSHRGTGPACSFRSAHYSKREKGPDVLRMMVELSYLLTDDGEYPAGNGGKIQTLYSDFYDLREERSKNFEFDIPITLVLDFKDSAFRTWIGKLEEKKADEALDEAKRTIEGIVKRFPDHDFGGVLRNRRAKSR